MKKILRVAEPVLGIPEIAFTVRALIASEISGYSKQFIPRFEDEFAKMCETKYAVAVNSGTSAIHLACAAIGIGPGDEVLVSSFTNMATFFPILQLGATPIPIDVDPITHNMDPLDLERMITNKTKAIVVVHIFGHPAPMDSIMRIANAHNVLVIEDCAEAHGAKCNGKTVGSFGLMGCFSFYANKLMTTGEGGMVTTNDEQVYMKLKSICSLSFGKENKFLHERDGYNFRMSNVQAGIGIAQLKRLPVTIRKKRRIAQWYSEMFIDDSRIQLPVENEGYFNVYWMFLVTLPTCSEETMEKIVIDMTENGIEVRRGFIPFSDQVHVVRQFNLEVRQTPIASRSGYTTLYLPSGPNLRKHELLTIGKVFMKVLDKNLTTSLG